jgi:hypothetical protein
VPCAAESRKSLGADVHSCATTGRESALVPPNCQSSTNFAFKPPLTMRMLHASALRGKSAIVIKSLLLVGRAHIAGTINL